MLFSIGQLQNRILTFVRFIHMNLTTRSELNKEVMHHMIKCYNQQPFDFKTYCFLYQTQKDFTFIPNIINLISDKTPKHTRMEEEVEKRKSSIEIEMEKYLETELGKLDITNEIPLDLTVKKVLYITSVPTL